MAFTTRGSLLSAVRRGDEIGWDEFYAMYKPLIYLKGSDLRLNSDEKDELVQLVMLSFFKSSTTFCYDKSQGRFRDYLKRIIHNKSCDLMRKRHNFVSLDIDEVQAQVEAELAPGDQHWDEEWQNHITEQVMTEIRIRVEPTTYQSFHYFVAENLPAKEIAKLLDIKPNAVNQHVARIKAMIPEITKEIDE